MALLKIKHGANSILTLLVIIFITILHSTQSFNISFAQENQNIIQIPYSNIIEFNEKSHEEQTRLLSVIFQNEYNLQNVTNEFATPHNLANYVVNYLRKYEKNEIKIAALAAQLMRPLGEYGSEQNEEILHAQMISVIHDWLKRSILGTSFFDWILNEIYTLKKVDNSSLLTHGYFEYLLVNQLNEKTENGQLSSETVEYYKENLLKEDMPSFLLDVINDEELEILQLLKLNEPEFGYLHVGLKVLREIQINPEENWKLDEIKDIGILIENLFRQYKITNIELFELPAKIYYASTLGANALVATVLGPFYEEYFKMIDHSRQGNPLFRLVNQLSEWQNRSALAKQILKANDISEEFLDSYLYHGESSERAYPNNKSQEVFLPSIDNIFEEQNKNITFSFQELDKILLQQVFDKLDDEDQKFFQAAEVNLVHAKLIDKKVLLESFSAERNTLINPISKSLATNKIDLLQCTTDEEERIYSLDIENYKLLRVDRDRHTILKLTKVEDPGLDYELKLPIISLLKNREEAIEILSSKLSEFHGSDLFEELKSNGYMATFWQKFDDFMLSLIPFYSCITNLNGGNLNDAAVPCAIDTVSLVPFFGQAIKIAYKFGSASLKASLFSLRLVTSETTIYQIVRQASKIFVNAGLPSISKTLSFKEFHSLGREFLRAVDPGIGFFKLVGGIKNIQLMKSISVYLRNGIPKLDILVERLSKRAEQELSSTNLISVDVLKTKEIVLLPDINKEATVVKIGSYRGQDLLVRVLETEQISIPFGRKYVRDIETGKIDLAPVSLREKIYQLKTQGLNGDSITVARTWEDWDRQTVSLTTKTQVNEVYRGDTRSPLDIITLGDGCRPRPGIHNYNLETHHVTYVNGGDYMGHTSPFVSTTSNLFVARSQLAYTGNLEKYKNPMSSFEVNPDIIGYIYKIRPNSNFYNLRDSYLAARDVCHPTSTRYETMNQIIETWGQMDEYTALGGFGKDRIIAYAPMMKNDDGHSQLEWTTNEFYNSNFDNNWSAFNLYTTVLLYKEEDAMDMAINMVQQNLIVTKAKARFLLTNLQKEKIHELVIKYNSHREDQLQVINSLIGKILV